MQDKETGYHTYYDLLQDGLQEGVVLGKITKNFLIRREIDEDREGILGYTLPEDGR